MNQYYEYARTFLVLKMGRKWHKIQSDKMFNIFYIVSNVKKKIKLKIIGTSFFFSNLGDLAGIETLQVLHFNFPNIFLAKN